MSRAGDGRYWLDRLALRTAGQGSRPAQEASPVSRTLGAGHAEKMTRAGALKRFGAAAALSMLPMRWMESPAAAQRDCFNPCLGIVKAAADRDIGKCRPDLRFTFLGGTFTSSFLCAYGNTAALMNERDECYKPDCGKLSGTIRNGGHLGNLPIPPLDLPTGTKEECQNCQSAGGYCGVCQKGAPSDTGFFCGTPGVAPCRYCGGC
jgi:hypothetical protein